MTNSGLGHRGAADEDGGHRVETDLFMTTVSAEGAHILQKDDMAPGCHNHGHYDSDDPDFIHLDACYGGHFAVLADGTHILTQFGSEKERDKKAQTKNHKPG